MTRIFKLLTLLYNFLCSILNFNTSSDTSNTTPVPTTTSIPTEPIKDNTLSNPILHTEPKIIELQEHEIQKILRIEIVPDNAHIEQNIKKSVLPPKEKIVSLIQRKFRPIASWTYEVQEEILQHRDKCWRMTGVSDVGGTPMIGNLSVIRMLYKMYYGHDADECLKAGCGLQGFIRAGCVNFFKHDSNSGHIELRADRKRKLISLRPIATAKRTIGKEYPSLYKEALNDEETAVLADIQKIFNKLEKSDCYLGKKIPLDCIIARSIYKNKPEIIAILKHDKRLAARLQY